MKRLVVISGSEPTRRELARQLEELFGSSVTLESHAVDNGLSGKVKGALVLLTSSLILDECKDFIDPSCTVLIAKRTLNFAHLDKLYAMPENSSLLIVNDAQQTADEVIELLKKIGFPNYRYQAYYPGGPMARGPFDFVITPGEISLIPGVAGSVIDIGPRILDITTIIEIVQSLGMLDEKLHEKIHMISAKYMRKIISLGKELHVKHDHLKSLNEFLLKIIDSVNDGICAYNQAGTIELINSIAVRILGLGEGANLLEARGQDRKLRAFLKEASLENYILQVEDATYLFSKNLSADTGICLLTIKNVRERINMENRLKSELKKQGYRAKYTFNDLIHRSKLMADLIVKGRKLAESEFSILIYGESGTGKEIFASAVHNASKRKNGPFLAVNFSALPDELIESELFGYEEGAFTGAKRGGKVGLFELASQGTLFLDEIGDISPKIQSRLLRVLQEKEVLKVGGTKNIPVDVRVVAATNKDLFDMVRQGRFREDLYYRLKKLYLHIPPLRQRREDIQPLFNHFLIQKNGFDLKLTEEARSLLDQYEWPGNVRELESNVEYILAVREGDRIDRSVLSEDLLKQAPSAGDPEDGLVRFLLRTIREHNEQNLLIGRKKLALLSGATRFKVSEQQARRVLTGLSAKGLVQMNRGRAGLRLTDAGLARAGGR
jgi:sigma-54 dependent transcriptional regulator, acetoin dehydrogenase operon transcriptional activator AcoR